MKLQKAQQIAENLLNEMKPWTERVMIAGSIRRGKPEVKDVELCVIPKFTFQIPKQLQVPPVVKKKVKDDPNFRPFMNLPSQWELFGNADNEKPDIPKSDGKAQNLLYLWGNRQMTVRWIKPGSSSLVSWEIKPEGKYWRGVIESEEHEPIKLDCFLLNPDNWGVLSTIRTGPADFSTALVTFIKRQTPFRVQEGHLTLRETDEIIPCAEEEYFFSNAGLEFVPIAERSDENPFGKLRLANKKETLGA